MIGRRPPMDPLKIVSPEVASTKEVTFHVLASQAQAVAVGDCVTTGGIAHAFSRNCGQLIRRTWAGIWPPYALTT